MMAGQVFAVCVGTRKGIAKTPQPRVRLIAGLGLEGDAHSGPGLRQVSLLAQESADKIRARGLAVAPGDFAENIATLGIDLPSLSVATRLKIGLDAVVEITQLGKQCHDRCAIYQKTGDCVMPREGIFARVLCGGSVRPGDRIETLA